MKKLFCLLLLFSMHAHATTYFFSATGNDDNNGTSPASPFKTITKFNAIFSSLQPGDKVFFKRGETFFGKLVISKSGTADDPITIGAYGTGAKPVITGFAVIPTWLSVGSGIWESNAFSTLDAVNMLTINGTEYAMGRYPNAGAPNKGYLTIKSHEGTTSITGNALQPAPDCTGGTVVMRLNHWTLHYATITAQSGTKITYSKAPSKEPQDGFGYFIQNHPATLDQFGEWYYNPSTKKLRMYFGIAKPAAYLIKASTLDNLVTIKDNNNLVFDNLNVQGADGNGFYLYKAEGVTISNSDILFCGDQGINAQQDENLNFTAENNTIAGCGNFGINLRFTGTGQVVRNNTIRKIGLFPGMGGTGPQSRCGIISNSLSGKQIEGNRIDSIGYSGIRFSGSDVVVQRNVVSNFTLTLDDGGGIYTANQNARERTNRKIINNLVYNGIGAKEGTNSAVVQQSSGIYVDDNASGVEIAGNSVWNCGKAGLYIHNAYKLNIHHNTFYNNAVQAQFTHDNVKYPTLTNIIFQYNTCVSKTAAQPVANFYTKENDIAAFGSFDNNFYLYPSAAVVPISVTTGIYERKAQIKSKHTPETWKRAYGHDANSKNMSKTAAAGSMRFEYNQTNAPLKITLDKAYIDVTNTRYSGTITVQPYTALLLLSCPSCKPQFSNPKPPLKGRKAKT